MIAVLMATYNGEKYIAEQIESLLSQTIQDFVLYINDDCSADKTYDIIRQYADRYPRKIIVSQNQKNSGSAKYNFISLMIKHKDEYMMLCDQDDIWLPNKIELTLAKMRNLESKHGRDIPILVHTDLAVTDENLAIVSPSFKTAMNANYDRTLLRQLLIQNTLTGCTAMYNRSLSDLIQTEPSFAIMHDWWLILIAGAFGVVGHIDEQTILYRQHSSNSIGAKDVRTISYKVGKLLRWREMKQAIADTYPQAQSLLDGFRDKLLPEQIILLETYCSIPQMNKINRWLAD